MEELKEKIKGRIEYLLKMSGAETENYVEDATDEILKLVNDHVIL